MWTLRTRYQLNRVRGEHIPVCDPFCCRDLDINPMTLILEGDLDILKMYRHTENEVAMLTHSKLLMMNAICTKFSQGQRSRSNVTNYQPVLAFTEGHIPNKWHQLLNSSCQVLCRRRDTTKQQYLLTAGMRAIMVTNWLLPWLLLFRWRQSCPS